jgi:hypothetical protein
MGVIGLRYTGTRVSDGAVVIMMAATQLMRE